MEKQPGISSSTGLVVSNKDESVMVGSGTSAAGGSENDRVSREENLSIGVENDSVGNTGVFHTHISTKSQTTPTSTITPSLSCPAMSNITDIHPSILTSIHMETADQSPKRQSSQIKSSNQSHHSITHYLLYRESSGRNKTWKSITLYGKFDHRVFGLEPNTHYDMVRRFLLFGLFLYRFTFTID